MANASVDKREKSLGEMILVILAFALLMATFIHYFFKNEDQINEAGFENLAANFASKIMLIRSQWLMDGRPDKVKIIELDVLTGKKKKHLVSVNKFGWVDNSLPALACQKIWQDVMAMPMRFVKQPISAIQLQHNSQGNKAASKVEKQPTLCRFSIQSGHFFEYSAQNGKVNSGK